MRSSRANAKALAKFYHRRATAQRLEATWKRMPGIRADLRSQEMTQQLTQQQMARGAARGAWAPPRSAGLTSIQHGSRGRTSTMWCMCGGQRWAPKGRRRCHARQRGRAVGTTDTVPKGRRCPWAHHTGRTVPAARGPGSPCLTAAGSSIRRGRVETLSAMALPRSERHAPNG